jgi:hypothetical protein
MKHKGFHRGLVFNHFPELMFYKTGFFKSYGHLILQVDRSAKNDNGITSDKKFFRDLRENKLSPNELVDYLLVGDYEEYKDEIVNDSLLTEDSETIGGWHVLASLVSGFKLTVKHRDIFIYLGFLEALCLVDKQFIVQQQETARSASIDPSNDAIKLWLEIDYLDITHTTDESGEKYLIALVLHCVALYEKFLFVHVRALTSDNHCYFDSLFLDCLPTIDSNGKLKRSISVLLEFRKKLG